MRYGNFDTKEGRVDEGEWGVDFFFLVFCHRALLALLVFALLLINACIRYPPLEKSYEGCTKAMQAILFNASTKPHSS
jgi:hypothetical protein